MSGRQFSASTPISGFPEWLPEAALVEAEWIRRIRGAFESYGFTPIETPAVESLDALLKKGETSQEVYTLQRLQADSSDSSDARLGLHFDLTVPFARYVAGHFNDLDFPFKRYQIQKVWRGERPQEGRFREFTQCDIDVINPDHVPLHFDAELPRVVHEILTALQIGPFTLQFNNRKVLEGFYRGLGAQDPIAVIRAMDKIDKIGAAGVEELLTERLGLTPDQAKSCLLLAQIRGSDASVLDAVRALGVCDDLLDEGLSELGFVIGELTDLPAGSVEANLSIARGLDYYTGTVYEGKFLEFPGYGSICSGGRYDDLAGSFIRRSLPGVGISIGLTRIFAKLLKEGRIELGPKCPTQVLVAVQGDDLAGSRRIAAQLRSRGVNTEVFHQGAKLGKQLTYASRKGIPYVWFPPFREGGEHEVKDLRSGDQQSADPAGWLPPAP
ncbi:MAG TPA: histidine--tRNA ligase [Kineosporiaceae bacterium]|nr:histidine--tRNA ligase [Kineosporiaceae bacterium]